MNGLIALLLTVFVIGLGVTPADAHPGDHSGFSFSGLAAHLFEIDHLVFLALIVLVAFSTCYSVLMYCVAIDSLPQADERLAGPLLRAEGREDVGRPAEAEQEVAVALGHLPVGRLRRRVVRHGRSSDHEICVGPGGRLAEEVAGRDDVDALDAGRRGERDGTRKERHLCAAARGGGSGITVSVERRA